MVSMAEKRDYYEVLRVSKDAAPDEIKKAYKQLALANHPDRNPDDESAIERFKEAAAAYEILGDGEKRQLYDRHGHAAFSGAAGRSGFQDVGDIFDIFGDLFEGFGFGGGRRSRRQRVRRGNDLQTSIRVSLLEAARGCEPEIEIRRDEICSTCNGLGAKPGSMPDKCDYCGGHGQVVQSQGFFRLQTTCPACRGQGSIIRDQCSTCRGKKRVSKEQKLKVKVPPGVDTDNRLILRGEGESGDDGGPRGDLYVVVKVTEHSLFKRDGQNLICVVPITYTQATLGAEIDIPVLEGKHRQTINPGTQPGDTIRIHGGGMPDVHGGRTGDLLIKVQVEVPRKVSPEHEALLRQLAEYESAEVSPHQKSFMETLKDWLSPTDNGQ
jgi:molecular chaperone DnaJ